MSCLHLAKYRLATLVHPDQQGFAADSRTVFRSFLANLRAEVLKTLQEKCLAHNAENDEQNVSTARLFPWLTCFQRKQILTDRVASP